MSSWSKDVTPGYVKLDSANLTQKAIEHIEFVRFKIKNL